MVSISKLSLETLKLIFSKLERKDLSQCERVCKKWKLPAWQFCYERVRLKNELQQAFFFQMLCKFRRSGLGDLLKSIYYHGRYPTLVRYKRVHCLQFGGFESKINIKHLILKDTQDWNTRNDLIDFDDHPIVPDLVKFKSLTSVGIEVISNSHIYSFDKYLDMMPHLNKLLLT